MPRFRFQLWSFVVVLVLFCSAPCFAQVQTGTPPFGSFGGGPDIVNLGNLNVHINVPVFSRAGRGMPFIYSLGYDTSVWYPVGVSGSQVWTPVSNWGWTSSTAAVTGHLSATETFSKTCPTFINPKLPPVDEETITAYTWTYFDSFGGVHPFLGVTTTWPSSPCGPAGSTGLVATAPDGSGYTLNANGNSASVYTRKGTLVGPPTDSFAGIGTLTDRNGNVISVDNSGNITDTLGTVALIVAGTGTPSSPVTFTYTAPNAHPASYTANYSSLTVKTNFRCSGIAEFGPTTENLLTSITLPDGSEYTFTYESTPGFSGDYTGRLASVTLPTGGLISYTYPGTNDGIECSDGSTASLTRTVNPGGEWQYTRSGSGTTWSTTISDPSSPTNQTVVNFQSPTPVAGSPTSFYETERQIYQGSTSGTLLETIYTCYNGAASPCNSTAVTQPFTQRTVVTQWPGSSGLESKTNISYNNVGLVAEKDEYAYGKGAPGSLVRKTLTNYAGLSNGIVLPGSVTVYDGSNNLKSQTTYCYDEGTPSGTSACAATGPPTATWGTPQHVAVTGSRGNVTTIASLVSTGSTLGKTYTYADTGNVLNATDLNGAQTALTYGSSSCGNSFATSIAEPLSLSGSMVWNCTGGVEVSVTDENNQTVSITYNDPDFWRPNVVEDQESNVTNIAYTGATSAESSLNFNGSISTSDALVTLDSLGRVHVSQVKESQSSSTYDSQETDYNSVGLASRATLPYAGGAGATNSTAPNLASTYDALGRILQATDSGNGIATYSYNQNDVLITSGPAPTGEKTKSRQYEYDALGRMTSVCEVTSATGSGSCAQNTAATGFLTQYTYDLNNNLIGVTQNAQASTTQTRTYTYDDLSRLTSEQNPESATTSYVYDSDSTCGTSKNDLVKKTDAVGNVSCYAYDSLHRLTSATYPSGSYAANTSNKYFIYDTATVNGTAMADAKTRLAEAYTAASSTGTKITDLGFSYSVRGEVSNVYESTPHSSGYYSMSATYWPNGALDQIGGLPTLPTLTYTPDGEGRPAIVTASAGQNPVAGTTYNPASLPTSMTLGSGDTNSFMFDPNTNRMTQFQFNVNSQSLTGTIDWNPLGTPASLDISDAFNSADTQNCSFAHDDLARLATVNCGTIWGQNFTYDAFGNITKTVLSGSSGTSFQPTYAVPSTNRIASLPSFTPTYDANGNLTKDPQHQYGWDSEGRPVTIDSVTLTYDALDRMVEQNNAGNYTQIVYDPLGGKFGLMNGQTLKKAFAPLPDGGIAAYTSSGLAYYRHPDWLGSSRLASTPTRTIYSDTAYAPFGEPYAQSGTADPSFTGQNQDTASNLYDFLYREHSSIQGRWISPDPAGLAAVNLTDPQSWNRYAYVGNRPLISIDQSGLYCMWDDGTTDDSVADGGIDEGGCDANGGTWIADGSDGYYGTGNYTTMQSCASLGGVLVNCSNTPIPYGSLSTDSTYNGNNGNTSSWSWGSTFVSALFTRPYRQPGESFAGCVNRDIKDTSFGALNPSKVLSPNIIKGELTAFVGVAIAVPQRGITGVFSTTVMTAAARGLGAWTGGGATTVMITGAVLNAAGITLAVTGAATAGAAIGAAVNCVH